MIRVRTEFKSWADWRERRTLQPEPDEFTKPPNLPGCQRLGWMQAWVIFGCDLPSYTKALYGEVSA